MKFMKELNILIFPGGSDVGVEIWKSLKDCKKINLFSANSAVSNHSPFIFKKHFTVPSITDYKWIDAINNIVMVYNIDYIFPAHDDVILALSNNKEKINAKILISPEKTCLICRSKIKTYEFFKDIIPVPKIFKNIKEIKNFPIFIKPDLGQGSRDAYKIDDIYSLKTIIKSKNNMLMMEYLPGKEFTIDCFSDRKKGLVFCKGRERVRTKAGAATHTKLVDNLTNSIFQEYAQIISNKLIFYGSWFFQVKQDIKYEYVLLEIAPRIAGTMSLNRNLGVNFPLLSIYEAEGIDIKIMGNNICLELDRSYINRYKHDLKYDKIYVDLDDTLIINNKVNVELIKFLYQCINNNYKIILLTKTENNLNLSLNKHKLNGLFDEIHVIDKNDCKSNYIDPKNSIFIDDSFNERIEVFNKLNIPTFDCSMIESLLDDRC